MGDYTPICNAIQYIIAPLNEPEGPRGRVYCRTGVDIPEALVKLCVARTGQFAELPPLRAQVGPGCVSLSLEVGRATSHMG